MSTLSTLRCLLLDFYKVESLCLDLLRYCEMYKNERNLLGIIAKGCKKHPSYRGIKEPRCDCKICQEIYQARIDYYDQVKRREGITKWDLLKE